MNAQQLFRPVYSNKYVTVTPKRWWSPLARRSARIAAPRR